MSDDDNFDDDFVPEEGPDPQKSKQKKLSLMMAEISKTYALTLYGNSAVIIKTDENPIRYLSVDTFHLIMANCLYYPGGKQSPIKVSKSWMAWAKRRYYDDVVFFPGDTSDRNVYNLWRGFAFEPDENGSCDLFLDHMRVNVCSENKESYEWLLDWMADAVQRPHRKNGTAILLESNEEGTGKGFFANQFGKLFGTHYATFNKPNQLLGQFNSHLEDKMMIFLDEGSLVEKHAYDFAKSLITEPTLNIEPKGRSMREVHSYHRIIMASNDDHILRASTHDRRWMVLRVASAAKNNIEYFEAITKELKYEGGYEKLMHILMTRKYKERDVRTIIKTDAQTYQKEQNVPPYIEWWKICLSIGNMGESDWPRTIYIRDFYKIYIKWCEEMKINKRESEFWLTRRLNDKTGSCLFRKGSGSVKFYEFMPLEMMRAAFEEKLGYSIRWDE